MFCHWKCQHGEINSQITFIIYLVNINYVNIRLSQINYSLNWLWSSITTSQDGIYLFRKCTYIFKSKFTFLLQSGISSNLNDQFWILCIELVWICICGHDEEKPKLPWLIPLLHYKDIEFLYLRIMYRLINVICTPGIWKDQF